MRLILLAALALIFATFATEASARGTMHFKSTGDAVMNFMFVFGGGLTFWWFTRKNGDDHK